MRWIRLCGIFSGRVDSSRLGGRRSVRRWGWVLITFCRKHRAVAMLEEQARSGDQVEPAGSRCIDDLQSVSCFVTFCIDMSVIWYASHCVISIPFPSAHIFTDL
jgi:hypothetical protein